VSIRPAEWFAGYVQVHVLDDPDRRMLAGLVTRQVRLWDVRPLEDGSYRLCFALTDRSKVLSVARSIHCRLRFRYKRGVPFLLWRARRRKVFLLGGLAFAACLYLLSSFVWTVQIEGTDQPEAVAAVLNRLHVRPGTLLYRLLDQDSLQLALLDQLPDIAWVGVRIQGTNIYVQVIPRVKPSDLLYRNPQSIVARVPGVVTSLLANSGLPAVHPGQFVTPGTVLISGVLSDGKTVYADGSVQADVWYRSRIALPEQRQAEALTGDYVSHDYLVIGSLALQVWGFSRPPYPLRLIRSEDEPILLGDVRLPLMWRKEIVYDARKVRETLSPAELERQALQLARDDVLRSATDRARVMRQLILQKKLERGKLYMSVWTEVQEDIGRAQQIASAPPPTTQG